MRWRLHSAIFSDSTKLAEAQDYLVKLGDSVQVVSGRRAELPPVDSCNEMSGPFLAITTLQDAKSLLNSGNGVPGLYWDRIKYDVSYWMPRLEPHIPVLNRDGMFWPLGMLQSFNKLLVAVFGIGTFVFIKPDQGNKAFTGFITEVTNSGLDLTTQHQLKHLSPETMCFVAPAVTLSNREWRFWVANRNVVAWSPYSWDGPEEPWTPVPANVLQVAENMARNPWQPDISYVVDVALVSTSNKLDPNGAEEPFLLELNAASTSGIYNVPIPVLLGALRDVAYRELAGELAISD